MDADTLIPFFKRLAEASSEVILPLFHNPDLAVEWKGDQTPVTAADRNAELALRKLIMEAFPDHGIIGEEFPPVNADSEWKWILDPIDGTRSFTAGVPLFGTLICLTQADKALWGAIHLPVLQRLYIGNNSTAWCNDRKIRIGPPKALEDCLLLTTDPKGPDSYQPRCQWKQLVASVGQYRSWGDCFGYTLLAEGRADIMTDPILNLWDIAALLPVIRGAGAKATDWKGHSADGAESLVACHPEVHEAVMAILNGT